MRSWHHRVLRGVQGALFLTAFCLGQSAGARAAELGPEEARELEHLLTELNFDPGAVDGVIDGRTRTAIALYQEFAALPVDGEPGPALLVELRQVVRAFAEINAAKVAAGETTPEPESEVAAQPGPEPEPEIAARPEPEPAPEVVAQPEPAPVPEPEPEVAAQPEPEPKPEPEVATQPEPEPEPEVVAQPAPEPEPEVAAALEPEPEPELEVAAQPEPEPKSRPEPEPESEPVVAPKSGFNLDNMIARLVTRDSTAGAPAGSDRDLVLAVQRQLARIGLDPGPIDGQLGARTSEAIQIYQGVRGLAVDGRPSRDLLEHLAREPDGPGGGPDPDQTSRVAENGALAQLLGAADGEKYPPSTVGTAPSASAAVAAPASLDGYGAFRIAFAAAEVGDFGRAIELYTRAIEGGDLALADLADAFYNRANARSYAKAYDFAIADYGAAILNKPEFPGAYYNRGFAFEANGQRTRALADFMKARALGLRRLGVRVPDQLPPRR